MVTKCTFIRDSVRRCYCNIPSRNCYINYDNGAYHCTAWRKTICNICIFPTRNWYIYCIILEDTIYIMGKDNLQHLYLYLEEADTFIGIRMFPTVHHREFLFVQRNSHYYPGITQGSFFINFCILINIFSTQLILSHAYTTHTSLRVPLSSLNFCLSNLDFGYLNNLAYLNEWWKPVPEIKAKLKTA